MVPLEGIWDERCEQKHMVAHQNDTDFVTSLKFIQHGRRVRFDNLDEIQHAKRILKDYLEENPAIVFRINCSCCKDNPSHDKKGSCQYGNGSIFKINAHISCLKLSFHLLS